MHMCLCMYVRMYMCVYNAVFIRSSTVIVLPIPNQADTFPGIAVDVSRDCRGRIPGLQFRFPGEIASGDTGPNKYTASFTDAQLLHLLLDTVTSELLIKRRHTYTNKAQKLFSNSHIYII